MKKKKLHEGMRGGGSIGTSLPLYFKRIQSTDMKLGMCNNCPVYFQLSIVRWHLIGFQGIVRWHLIGFQGNHSNIMTSLIRPPSWIFRFSTFFIFTFKH